MNFSDNLKRLRKENNLSQEELAEKLNVSRQSVSKWESNSAYPEMDKIIQISNMFNIGIDELLNKNISEVQEEKQVKSTINKYIDDFLSFISKSIDMFLNMKFKDKCKFIFEECLVVFILWILFLILGKILSNIFYSAFSFISRDILYNIENFLGSVYTLLSICLGVIITLHIFKTRYLDYYIIVDKEEISTNKEINNIEVSREEKEFISDKREKVIIRDPEHSGYRFINGLLKLFLILIKINAAFIFFGFSLLLICLVVSFVLTFMVSRTGLFFIGLVLSVISGIALNIVFLDILFNFIFNHKSKWRLLFIIFIASLLVLGSGIGIATVGFSSFNIDNENNFTDTYEKVIPMSENLIVHENYNGVETNYIESDNSDIRIVINYSKGVSPVIHINDNLIYTFVYEDYENIMELIREQLKDINAKKIKSYHDYEINVYTNKNNIDTLKSNYNSWLEGE